MPINTVLNWAIVASPRWQWVGSSADTDMPLLDALPCFYLQTAGCHQPPAFLDELETYIEGLYEEDLTMRAAAAGMLCQLFRQLTHLEVGKHHQGSEGLPSKQLPGTGGAVEIEQPS